MGTKVAETIPIGSRVLGENPQDWDYDSSLPELDGSWLVAKMSVKKDNGIWVDVEMIRPAAFWHRAGAFAGGQIMLTFAELEISNLAKVHSLEPTPPIAIGEGNVVTARMTTRQTHQLLRVQFSDQTTLIGTPAHPIWSVSVEDWVDLEELDEGDLVLGESGPLEVVSTELIETLEPVYNLEVYGEHVYHVEQSGILVHNGKLTPKYRGPKAKRVKVVVLGEGVPEIKVAVKRLREKGIDAHYYKAWAKNFPKRPLKPSEMDAAIARNMRWMRMKYQQGYTFRRIGLDPKRPISNRSPFYAAEKKLAKELGIKLKPLYRRKI